MEKKNISRKEEVVVYSKEDNKNFRVIKFLEEVKKEDSKEKIKDLYLNKYKLSERKGDINLRVLERGVFFKNNKINEEILLKNRSLLIEKLKEDKFSLDYKDLIVKLNIVKEKEKRSNRLNSFLEVKF